MKDSASRTHLVTILEQLHLSALGYFESHLEKKICSASFCWFS